MDLRPTCVRFNVNYFGLVLVYFSYECTTIPHVPYGEFLLSHSRNKKINWTNNNIGERFFLGEILGCGFGSLSLVVLN